MNPAETIEQIHDKASSDGFAALDNNEQIVWVVASADFETNLGGASGYLYNTAGDHLPLLVTAFEAIGCAKLATVARTLLKELSAVSGPADRDSRYVALSDPSPELAAAMDAFESGIQDCADNYDAQLESFIDSWS